MCRSFEKPAYDDVVQLLDHFCEKSKKLESQLYLKECELYRTLETNAVLKEHLRGYIGLLNQTRVQSQVQTPVRTPIQTFVQTPVHTPVHTPVQTPARVSLRRRRCQGNCAIRITQRACSDCRLSNCCRECRICVECNESRMIVVS